MVPADEAVMTFISSPVMERPRAGRASAIVAIRRFLPLCSACRHLAGAAFAASDRLHDLDTRDARGSQRRRLLPTGLRPKVKCDYARHCLGTINAAERGASK